MLNQIVLVGRIVSIVMQDDDKGNRGVVTISVPASVKDENGEYPVDKIEIELFDNIAKNTVDYCKKGDVIGVKGRIQKRDDEPMKVVAEKVTFLTSRKGEEENYD